MALGSKRNVGSAADELKAAAASSAADLSGQIRTLRARLEDLVESLAEAGEDGARVAARQARHAAKWGVDRAERGYDLASDRAHDAGEAAARLTKERPGLALGLAAGFGLLAGIMLMRR